LLQGKTVNLRVREKEDLLLYAEWCNDPEFQGRYFFPTQISKTEIEKLFESNPFEVKTFIIEKKDGARIGIVVHFNVLHPAGKIQEMGYNLIPTERGKGYCTEAARIMLDYLFLTKDIACVQATTHIGNVASQRVLEKIGFKKEGTMRKRFFINGEWEDAGLFSILREEWKEPKILTKAQAGSTKLSSDPVVDSVG
jgi:RimJ/RimL family protein N-acetyltransferase